MAALSPRQQQCLELSKTLHDDQIADRLGISVHTVRTHIRDAKQKLGVQDRKAAIRALPTFEGGENWPVANTAPDAPTPVPSGSLSDDDRRSQRWPLPTPPRSKMVRFAIILVVAVLTAIVFAGVLSVLRGSIQEVSTYAPENGA